MDSSLSESLGSLLAATVAFAIGTSVVLRDRAREQFVLFGVFCFNLGLFHLARFFYGFSNVTLFEWVARTISVFLPWCADRCFSSFIPSPAHRGGKIGAALLVLLLVAQTLLFALPSGSEHPLGTIVPIALDAYVIGGLLLVASRMWRAARAVAGTAAASRLRYLFYASLVALVFGSPIIPAVGPIVTAVYLYFVAQTLVRERLLELPEVLGRIASMSLLVLAMTVLFSLLLLWIPVRGGAGAQPSLFVFIIAVASFAVIVLIDPVRTEFESRIESWMFRDRYVLRAILVQLRGKLLNVIDPDEMAQAVIDALRDSNRVTRASVYVIDRYGTSLTLRGNVGQPGPPRLDFATRRPLLARMRLEGAQLRDVLQRERERASTELQAELDDTLATLTSLGASLAVPILGHVQVRDEGDRQPGDLLGALLLDDERLLEPFSREEVQLFEGVAAQAAITIQNSAVYEQRKERDRLAALGEMAAGLAHEIRNPLGAIKGAVQVVEPTFAHSDPHTHEFLAVIVEEVERLNRVVSQFLTYSRPFKGEAGPVNLLEVLRGTLRLLPEDARQCVTVVEPDVAIPSLRGDADALRQVLHNLVLNGLDAISSMHPPGKVTIAIERRPRGLPIGDAVAISVRDNGPGLSPHTLSNLFVPFHTTKSGGTGLGLPISQRIVENHQGVIEAGNAADGGAKFTVVLPIDELTPRTSGAAS